MTKNLLHVLHARRDVEGALEIIEVREVVGFRFKEVVHSRKALCLWSQVVARHVLSHLYTFLKVPATIPVYITFARSVSF